MKYGLVTRIVWPEKFQEDIASSVNAIANLPNKVNKNFDVAA